MNAVLMWDNLVRYSLQIGLLVGLAALVPAALGMRMPAARLVYWHCLLAACLLLPALRPWRQQSMAAVVETPTTVLAVRPAAPAAPWRPSPAQAALLLLAAGTLARLGWLGIGLARLSRYRRRSLPLEPAPSWSIEAGLYLSGEVSSPVTFGIRKPVILLPASFPELDAGMRDAILCHEVLHVRRRDWVFTLAEELVRAVFWFHPAIWWLLGEIGLAREQAVDREVVEMTQARDQYLDALLAIAGARPRLDLAPAPLFLRKRHLKQRVVSILKEARMSKTRWISALAAGLAIMAAACWFVTATFPLAAAPQVVADAPGVTVDTGGAALMHRAPVAYPEAARARNIQGNVVIEVKLDGAGSVSDARVISGPDELRGAALQSVLEWHFAREAAGVRQVSIAFQLPQAAAQAAASAPPPQAQAAPTRLTLKSISITGISDAARSDLLGRLPVHEGDVVDVQEAMRQATQAVKEFDEHLRVGAYRGRDDFGLVISPRTAQPQAVPATTAPATAGGAGPSVVRVGGKVQQFKLITQPVPVYPVDAKAAHIQGVVRLQATIAKDGAVKHLEVLEGHPLLVDAAMDAVKQWVYQPTELNGNAVEVITQIDVNFTLSQ
jgi:TonB family protein